MVKSSSGVQGLRSFTIVDVTKHGGCRTKFTGGLYKSRNPVGAARKAFSEFCNRKRIRGRCALSVVVKETTQGSAGKMYSYKLQRVRLQEPIIRLEGTPNEFVIEYTVKCKSAPVPSACRKEGKTRGRMKKVTRGLKKRRLRPNNVRRNTKKRK